MDNLPPCTGWDTDQAMELIWHVLQDPNLDPDDDQWDDICTAMSWIQESLDADQQRENT